MTATWFDVIVIMAGGACIEQAVAQEKFSWWTTSFGVIGAVNVASYLLRALT